MINCTFLNKVDFLIMIKSRAWWLVIVGMGCFRADNDIRMVSLIEDKTVCFDNIGARY